jgi:phosphodiesterase/alkaline phosphatase D-like protein
MEDRPATSRDRLGLRFEFPDGELERWFVLGDVTDRSVKVWIRRPAGPVTASLRIDGEGEPVVSVTIVPSPEADHVGAAVLDAGASQAGAHFEVEVDGDIRRATFGPAPGTPARFSFAFGSCHQPYRDGPAGQRLERHAGAGIYRRLQALLAERGAAFAMLLGDQVYSDAVSRISVREALAADEDLSDADLLETYRHLYRGFFNERGFRELAESLPTYLIWDDHDIFDGWGSLLTTTDFDRRLYRAAETAYREYQHLRAPGGSLEARAPYAYGMWQGDVGFFVLDLRGDRDYEAGRIIGDQQWQRLDAFLADATDRAVTTVFIAASVPVVHASPAMMAALERWPTGTGRDIRDRWDVPTFAHERTALLERLFAWQSGGDRRQVVILSGDVHVAAAFSARQREGRGHLRQWTSSALSTPGGLQHVLANKLVTSFVRLGERELRVWRRGLATGNNAGVVDVVPAEGGGHHLTFTVFQYDARRDRLREAFIDRADPRAPAAEVVAGKV